MPASQVASYSAQLKTHDDARVQLGRALRLLSSAYARLSEVPTLGRPREAARRLLDSTRGAVENTFQRYQVAGGDLPPVEKLRAGRVLAMVEKTLSVIDNAAKGPSLAAEFLAGFKTVLSAAEKAATETARTLGRAGASVANTAGNIAGAALAPLWPVLALVGVGAAVYFTLIKRL